MATPAPTQRPQRAARTGPREWKYFCSCHCKRICFNFKTTNDLDQHKFLVCNCTICTKNGYIMFYVPKEDVEFVKPDETLIHLFDIGLEDTTSYRFGPGNRDHRFCPACGTSVMIISNHNVVDDGRAGINIRCVENLEVDKLKMIEPIVDGKARTFAQEARDLEVKRLIDNAYHCPVSE